MTAMRNAMFAAFKMRLQSIGYTPQDADIAALCDDAETCIAADASAQSDAQTDINITPAPPQEQE